MNTSCSVWQLQFSEEMLFPSWARWETLDKTFLDSILCLSLIFLGVVVVCCCFFVSLTPFILLISLLFSLLLSSLKKKKKKKHKT